MKSQKNSEGPLVLCWIAAALITIALGVAAYVRSSLSELGQTANEINSVATILDSLSGLRSLVISFANQCSVAQESWLGAANTLMGILFLISLVGIALLATLAVQVKLNRKLTRQLHRLQRPD